MNNYLTSSSNKSKCCNKVKIFLSFLFLLTFSYEAYSAKGDILRMMKTMNYKNMAVFKKTITQNMQHTPEFEYMLQIFAHKGECEHIRYLAELENFHIYKNNSGSGNTALHRAVESEHAIVVEILLANGCSQFIKNANNELPAHIAIRKKTPHILQLFEENTELLTLKIIEKELSPKRSYSLNYNALQKRKEIPHYDIDTIFNADKLYKNMSIFIKFLSQNSNNTDVLGLALRKLSFSGDIIHVELIAGLSNFDVFKNNTSSNEYTALDWSYAGKHNKITEILFNKGCSSNKPAAKKEKPTYITNRMLSDREFDAFHSSLMGNIKRLIPNGVLLQIRSSKQRIETNQ